MDTETGKDSDTVSLYHAQTMGLAAMPTHVLVSLGHALQLQAITKQCVRDSRRLFWDDPKELRCLASKPAFKPLRLCCSKLRSINDSVRTSIRFSVDDMDEVEPYLQKLQGLKTVAVDYFTDKHSSNFSSCLKDLHSVVPCLEVLILRCGAGLGENICHAHACCI